MCVYMSVGTWMKVLGVELEDPFHDGTTDTWDVSLWRPATSWVYRSDALQGNFSLSTSRNNVFVSFALFDFQDESQHACLVGIWSANQIAAAAAAAARLYGQNRKSNNNCSTGTTSLMIKSVFKWTRSSFFPHLRTVFVETAGRERDAQVWRQL